MITLLRRTGILCLFVWLFSAISYAEIYSGDCGYNGSDSLQWELNTETKTLDIFCKYPDCNARMNNYNWYSSTYSPWNNYRDYIRTITLSGVSSIGDYAFINSSSLTSINIPNSVTSIGNSAFQYCYGLTSVNIGNSVTSIGERVFSGCSNLTSVNIGNSVHGIGDFAFYNCSSLTAVTIPNSVTWIAQHAFNGCAGLTSITIPNSVTGIAQGAFQNCSSLKTVTLESNAIVSKSGSLKSYFGEQVNNYIIGNNVTHIDNYAFRGCTGLTSITIGSGVLSIGIDAFSNTSIKKAIWLTNTPPSGYTNVNGIRNYVANDLYSNLANVTIYPFLSSLFEVNGVKYVPVSPSERTCDAIDCVYDETAENINIGETVTYRGVSLSLKQINPYLCYGNTYIKDVILNFIGDVSNYAFANCNNMQTAELGQEITSIGASSFSGCSKLENVIIPDSVSSIGNNAFENCTAMTSVKIGSGVKTIPTYAFSGCSSLVDVQIGNGVTSINYSAFSGCSSLPTIQIPQNVTSIDNHVFSGCKGLKTILMDDGEAKLYLGSNDSNPLFANCPLDSVYIGRNITYPTASDKGYSPFYNNKSLRTIIITDKETEITPCEFYGCSALQAIELGEGIKSIGSDAFKDCSMLQSIVIPDSVASIGNNVFENCSSIKSVKIGTGVKTIPASTFSGCSTLPTIQIPQNVVTIADYVFNGCKGLKTVLMDEGEGELSLGCNGSSPLFVSCPLDSVYIGRNIAYPTASNSGYSPFYRNTSLRSVAITDRETEISMNEFYGCTGLKNVRIGDGVTTIGDWAFSGCRSLDYFSFGSSVENIGKEAFSDCTALTKLISKADIPPVCGENALNDINKWDCTLLVPYGYVAEYQAAPQWKEFFFIDIDVDAIGEVNADEKVAEVARYDAQGCIISKPQKGINIIRYSDGTSKIILVK